MKPHWKRLWIWCIATMEPTLLFSTMQPGAHSQENCGRFTMSFPRSSPLSIMWLWRSPLSGQVCCLNMESTVSLLSLCTIERQEYGTMGPGLLRILFTSIKTIQV